MSRSEQRGSFPMDVRVELLEGDVDEAASDLKSIKQLATGILTALVVASVMLAINLAVAR